MANSPAPAAPTAPAAETPPTAPAAEVPANPNPAPTEAPVAAAPAEPAPNGSLLPEGEAATPAVEGDPASPEPAAEPLTIEGLALPEGMAKDDPALGKFLDVMNDSKLSPKERSEALLGSYKEAAAEVAKQAAAETHKAYTDLNATWVAEVKADPVIGKPEALASIAKAIDAYGNGPEVRKALTLTGAGNNPHVIRLLHSMAQRLGEGSPAQGSTPAPTKTLAQQFYPGTPETPSQG